MEIVFVGRKNNIIYFILILYPSQNFLDQFFNTWSGFRDAACQHIGRSRYDFVLFIYNKIIHGTYFMLTSQLFNLIFRQLKLLSLPIVTLEDLFAFFAARTNKAGAIHRNPNCLVAVAFPRWYDWLQDEYHSLHL